MGLASSAQASGFLNPRLADPHGHPALANPYAVYFNPAALGGVQGTQLVIDGTLAYRTVDYTRTTSALYPQLTTNLSNPTYVRANTGKAHAGNIAEIPFVAASSDFGTRQFFAGVGAYVPFGGAVKFDERPEFQGNTEARGALDGSQRWAVISGTQRSLYTTAAAGFRLPDAGLSFGISGSVVFSEIKHNQARNISGYDDTNIEGRALVDVKGIEAAFSAGVYWEVLPKHALRIGASYALRPALGQMRLSGTLHQHYGKDELTKDVDFLQTYPDVIRLGLAARPWGDTVELRLEGEYVTWSVFDHQCILEKGYECPIAPDGSEAGGGGHVILAIPRRWRDAGAVRAGAGYFLDEKTELFGAVGYDTSAVPLATLETTYPDAFKLMGSLGARRAFTETFALGASYTYVAYLPVTAPHQHQVDYAGASKVPNEDGKYSSAVMFINVNATFAF